jgi:hypothetical protein
MINQTWTNDEIIHEFLWILVNNIYDLSDITVESFREICGSEDDDALRKRIIAERLRSMITLFAMLDDAIGPSDWPGITLANRKTGERLTEAEIAWEFSSVEGEYLDTSSS